MAEKQHVPLEDGHLEQHEPGTERTEVYEPRQPSAGSIARSDGQRSNHEENHERERNAHQGQQRAQAVAKQHRSPEGDLKLVAQLGSVKEEWPVIGRWSDVLTERLVESLTIARADQSRVVVVPNGGVGRVEDLEGHTV